VIMGLNFSIVVSSPKLRNVRRKCLFTDRAGFKHVCLITI